MAYTIKDAERDLNRQLREYKPKERVTFHRGNQVHGKTVKAKNRHDRRSTRASLRRGDWA